MAFMVLRLLDDPETVELSYSGEQADASAISKITPLHDAIAEVKDKKVFLIVPGLDVISFEKALPKMPMNKLIKALPYAIEDQLLEAIDQYHLVIEHLEADGRVSVLVTPYRNMNAWLAYFKDQLFFDAMLPDYLLLPYEPGVWHIAVEKNILMRTGLYRGFVCDKESWQQIFELLWQETPEELRPKKLVIHQYGDSSSLDTSKLNIFSIIIEQHNESTSLLSIMTEHLDQNQFSGNLLQDKFVQEHHLVPMKKTAIIMASVFAVALIISLLTTIIQFIVLKRQDNFLQAQITAIYKQIYPAATSVVAPQTRVEGTLKELKSNQAGNGYLGVLMLTGKVLKQLPAIQMTSLRYQDNQLVIELRANNFKSLDLALEQLNRNNLTAKQDQGATKDNQVVARFTIQEK